jgi:hypothetical protein
LYKYNLSRTSARPGWGPKASPLRASMK